MEEYTVYTVKPGAFEEPMVKALWLGHHRYRCQNCKKGYFSVWSTEKHDVACDHCKFYISVRYTGRP